MNEFQVVEAGERAPQRLRRMALDLADDAIVILDQVDSRSDKAIHDIRRRLKELRAIADLVRSAIPQGGRAERAFFRDAGRQLAGARDKKAALEAFDRLRDRFSSEWTPRQFTKIRRVLAARTAPEVDPQTMDQIRRGLIVERGHIAAWPVEQMKKDDLWRALSRSYRRARRSMSAALEERTAPLLHEWRIQSKRHWYHAQHFVTTGLASLEPHADALRKLSRALGDYHDLVVMDELLRQSPEAFGSARYVKNFRRFIARRMKELESDAEFLGRDIFAERTRTWQARAQMFAAAQDARSRFGPKKSPARTTRRSSAVIA